MKLGEKLQRLRKARGWSQEKLAQQLGVSRQAVSKWEVDAAQPDVQNILQISNLFGVSTDYLLREEEMSEKSPSYGGGAAPDKKLRWLWGLAWGFLLTGLAGLFTIWILSTILPSVAFQTVQRADNFYETIEETVYRFWPFITSRRLEAVFASLCVFVLAGGILFWIRYRKKNNKEILPW